MACSAPILRYGSSLAREFLNSNYGGWSMKFRDLFVAKYLHSDPEVRLKFVMNSKDAKLLRQMSEKDDDERVRRAAAERADSLLSGQRQPA